MASSSSEPYNDDDTDVEESNEPPAEIYRWEIDDFPAMQRELEESNNRFGSRLSEVFVIGGCQWQLLLFPHGNGDGKGSFLSLYLMVADKDVLPEGWRREARFWLYIVNGKDEKLTVRQQTSTVASDDWDDWKAPEPFSAKKHDWGFPKMIALHRLNGEGFLVEGKKLIIQAEITVFRAWIDYRSLRTQRLKSREETGYVGIYNQAATCYLNAWLQALFHTGAFRKAVYQIPTGSANLPKSIPLALQRLFYRLQFHEDSVETIELTNAFGWTAADVSQQHDVHELNCKLLDNLEKKMKGTPADGAIERLFRGEIVNFIECVNVDYKSEVPEAIYDFGLVVKGCRDIYESFDKYLEVEMLDGDNQYRAEGFGLQDARKGIRISKLPPVLMLQLQRWELDMVRFVTYKVNDKYVFHPVLDLSRFLPAGYKESAIYHLHAILVHTGGAGAGHYYAYIRPNTRADWLLFDDSRVAKATEKQAIEDNWGGFEEHSWRRFGETIKWTHPRSSNAYMLLYVRETEAHNFMGFETGEDAIPEHVHKVGEEHLYMDVLVAQSSDLAKHDQNKFDLLTRKDVKPTKVRRQATVRESMATLAELTGVPVEHQRLWMFRERQNKTFRLRTSPLTNEQLAMPFEVFASTKRFIDSSRKVLYLEDTRDTGAAVPPPNDDDDQSIYYFFFKYYDPATQTVEYVGSHVFNGGATESVAAFAPVCNRLKNFPDDTPLCFWEEETADKLNPLRPDTLFGDERSDFLPGDIIVFARALPAEHDYALPDPPSWYAWKRHGITVRFRKLETPTDTTTEFKLELSKRMMHDEVAVRVARHLGLDDHHKLRFTGLASHADAPRIEPCRTTQNLKDMLTNFYSYPTIDILFYEILPVTLAELDQLKQVTVSLQNARAQVTKTVKVFVAKTGTVRDVVAQAVARADPDTFTHGTGKFRLMDIWTYKINRVLPHDTALLQLPCQSCVLEEAAPEEDDIKPGDQLVRVSHFEISPYQNPTYFGNPFMILVRADDTGETLKKRIQEKLAVNDEDFAKYRLAIIDYAQTKFVPDDFRVASFDFSSSNYSQLGLNHPDDSFEMPTWHDVHHQHADRILKFEDDE